MKPHYYHARRRWYRLRCPRIAIKRYLGWVELRRHQKDLGANVPSVILIPGGVDDRTLFAAQKLVGWL